MGVSEEDVRLFSGEYSPEMVDGVFNQLDKDIQDLTRQIQRNKQVKGINDFMNDRPGCESKQLSTLVCLPACLFLCLSVCLPAFLSVSLAVYLSVCLPVCVSVCLLPVCLRACLSFCLPVCLSVGLSVCLSICLPVYLPS